MSEPKEDLVVFDHAYLDDYTSQDEDLQREVLLLFFGQIDSLVDGLDPEGTAEDWKAAAHAIKGSARGLGMKKMAHLCEHLEEILEEAGDVKVGQKAGLVAEVKAVRTEVVAHYPGIFAP